MPLPFATTRNLFFTGKGGVGKTSLSCATAIALADEGKRVLLVSTDPASNLDEVLGLRLSTRPSPIPDVAGLFALNINPEEAARQYRERLVAPYRGLLPEASLHSIEEQLSGACTVEIAAFDEFAKLLGEPAATADFDHVVFDTAPTGHTLRLLELPSAWSGFLDSNTSGTSCLGPLAGLQAQQSLYRTTLSALADPALTTIVLVSRPTADALREAERTRLELAALRIDNQHLIVNGIFSATDPTDPVATALEGMGQEALRNIPQGLADLPRTEQHLMPHALLGVTALRAFLAPFHATRRSFENDEPPSPSSLPRHLSLRHLVDSIAAQDGGVVLVMGKGGVGKTSIASAIALELAARGHSVHLSTTDPAAHLSPDLAGEAGTLTLSCINPEVEVSNYSAEVLATAGSTLDEQGRRLLEEDLRSPCTEEIAVFRAFAHTVAQGRSGFVVLDTAPTGHTLLLLDAAESYHREVSRTLSDMPEAVRQLLPRLRDADFTKILLVTLPEATPVHEAAALQDDLRRADIQPFAWVINQSLTPLTVRDPVLLRRQRLEARYLEEVSQKLATRLALIPWQTQGGHSLSGIRAMIAASTP